MKFKLLSVVNINLEQALIINVMGDSRKYPYPPTEGFSEFRRHGGVLWTGIPEAIIE